MIFGPRAARRRHHSEIDSGVNSFPVVVTASESGIGPELAAGRKPGLLGQNPDPVPLGFGRIVEIVAAAIDVQFGDGVVGTARQHSLETECRRAPIALPIETDSFFALNQFRMSGL